jgi:hypothetical protein
VEGLDSFAPCIVITDTSLVSGFDDSIPIYRQMLDQAGSADVPVGYYWTGSVATALGQSSLASQLQLATNNAVTAIDNMV